MRSNRRNCEPRVRVVVPQRCEPWVRKKWVICALVVACGGAAATGGFEVTEPEDLGVDHLSQEAVQAIVAGELDPADYSSVPATSGQHAPSPTPCGVYRQEVPEMFNVHALEHGAVIFYYQPELVTEAERGELEELGRQLQTHVIVMPFAAIDHPLALVAWGKLARLETFDPEAARAFWAEFAQLGPESGIACEFSVDEGQSS